MNKQWFYTVYVWVEEDTDEDELNAIGDDMLNILSRARFLSDKVVSISEVVS